MNNLGILLADSDPVQARKLFQRAAEAGFPKAMNNLRLLD
jgi:TPR repeat protein